MGIARKIRRNLERQRNKASAEEWNRRLDIAARKVQAEVKAETYDVLQDEKTKDMFTAMYYLFGIHAARLFSLDGSQVMELYKAVDEEIGSWKAGEVFTDDLVRVLAEETGIEVSI